MDIVVVLKETLNIMNITQKELSERTGIREATISDIVNNRRSTINKKHLAIIMEELGLEKLDDVIRQVEDKQGEN